jgi:hypothetical protein
MPIGGGLTLWESSLIVWFAVFAQLAQKIFFAGNASTRKKYNSIVLSVIVSMKSLWVTIWSAA